MRTFTPRFAAEPIALQRGVAKDLGVHVEGLVGSLVRMTSCAAPFTGLMIRSSAANGDMGIERRWGQSHLGRYAQSFSKEDAGPRELAGRSRWSRSHDSAGRLSDPGTPSRTPAPRGSISTRSWESSEERSDC